MKASPEVPRLNRLPLSLRSLVAAGLCLAAPAATASGPPPGMAPAEAIAAVDRSARGVRALFEMRVASTRKNARATFLNSDPDYRAPGNVTFSLSPAAAAKLKKRFGAPPEEYLRGRRVIVWGIMEKRPIVNLLHGRVRSLNRFSYELPVRQVSQIIFIN